MDESGRKLRKNQTKLKIQIHGNENPHQKPTIQRLNFHHSRAQVQDFFEIRLLLDKNLKIFEIFSKFCSQTQNFLHF